MGTEINPVLDSFYDSSSDLDQNHDTQEPFTLNWGSVDLLLYVNYELIKIKMCIPPKGAKFKKRNLIWLIFRQQSCCHPTGRQIKKVITSKLVT